MKCFMVFCAALMMLAVSAEAQCPAGGCPSGVRSTGGYASRGVRTYSTVRTASRSVSYGSSGSNHRRAHRSARRFVSRGSNG